jgi:sulfonate transport system substrate-binding protein
VELDASARQKLLEYPWPGNIRELENAIHHALVVCEDSLITAADIRLLTAPLSALATSVDAPPTSHRVPLSPSLPNANPTLPSSPPAPTELGSADARRGDELDRSAPLPVDEHDALAALDDVLLRLVRHGVPALRDRVEAALLRVTYRYAGQNQLETARLLGMSRNVVRARLIQSGELPGPLRRSARTPLVLPSRALKEPRPKPIELAARRDERRIRVGYQRLGLVMLMQGHQEFENALRARGYRVEWQEYEGGIQIVDALARAELDFGVVGDCPAVFAQAENVPIVYVAAEPPAPHGSALVVPENSRVRNVHDLRGQRIAVNRASQAHYLLLRALEEAGLAASDVEISYQPPQRALRAFQSGAIDAWAVWDPWLSSACLDFGARVVRDATGFFKNSVYYVAHRDFAQAHPALIEEVFVQLREFAQWVRQDPRRAATRLAPALGLSSRALVESL